MAVVAHEDDSILFMAPDLLHDIHAGRCMRTVFVTAGDAGKGPSYWMSRERGSEAAYAEMAGVANRWIVSDAGIGGHPMPLLTLSAAPKISIVFMRLPNTWDKALEKLYTGFTAKLGTVDGSSAYTRPDLTSVLSSLMAQFRPDVIRTQDFVGSFGDGDHSDHHAIAYFTRDAHRDYRAVPHALVGYLGYNARYRPANVNGTDYAQKLAAWHAYTPYDRFACQTDATCQSTPSWAWLQRQYRVGSEAGGPGVTYAPIADAGPIQTVAAAATVHLDGSGSIDPSGAPAYRWTQTAGPGVTLSSAAAADPTFRAPDSAARLTFQLVVADGQLTSRADSVTITVDDPHANLAPLAVVTASSEAVWTGQQAVKAVDGVIGGYPGAPTHEWATAGGRAGSWLNLSWGTAVTVAKVVLYDRPNLSDQITGARLAFGGGGTVAVPALANDGSATTVTFPAVSTTSLRLTVDSVSATTRNVGLAELQVYGPGP